MHKIHKFGQFIQESLDFVQSVSSDELKEVEKMSKSLTSLKGTDSLEKFEKIKVTNTVNGQEYYPIVVQFSEFPLRMLEDMVSSGKVFGLFPYWSEDYNGIRLDFDPKVAKGKAIYDKSGIITRFPAKFLFKYNADSLESLAQAIDDAFRQVTEMVKSIRIRPSREAKIPKAFIDSMTIQLKKDYVQGIEDFFWGSKQIDEKSAKEEIPDLLMKAIIRDPNLASEFGEIELGMQDKILASETFKKLENKEIKASIEKQNRAKKLLDYL